MNRSERDRLRNLADDLQNELPERFMEDVDTTAPSYTGCSGAFCMGLEMGGRRLDDLLDELSEGESYLEPFEQRVLLGMVEKLREGRDLDANDVARLHHYRRRLQPVEDDFEWRPIR